MDRGWAEGKQAINRQKWWEFQSSIANYTHCSISSLYQRSIPEIVMERSTKMMNSGAVKCSNGDLTNKNCGIMGYFMGIFQLAPHFGIWVCLKIPGYPQVAIDISLLEMGNSKNVAPLLLICSKEISWRNTISRGKIWENPWINHWILHKPHMDLEIPMAPEESSRASASPDQHGDTMGMGYKSDKLDTMGTIIG